MTDPSPLVYAPPAPPAAPAPLPSGVGRVALVAAIALAVVSVLLAIVVGVIGAPYVEHINGIPSFNFRFGDPDPTVSALGLITPLHVFLGSLLGAWIIVQSIVAIAANRGRKQGVIALILAVVTPIVSAVLFLSIMFGVR